MFTKEDIGKKVRAIKDSQLYSFTEGTICSVGGMMLGLHVGDGGVHNCNGSCPDGEGYWVFEEDFDLIEEIPLVYGMKLYDNKAGLVCLVAMIKGGYCLISIEGFDVGNRLFDTEIHYEETVEGLNRRYDTRFSVYHETVII